MSTLYIVSTPIGNLADISFRAIETLKSVDVILAEDTRVTDKLLSHYNIEGKKLVAFHQHSPESVIEKISSFISEGINIALVTDAGTPGIQDPGGYLISQLLKSFPDLKISPIPGASAVLSALSVSGFVTDRFFFLGFPPHKKGRKTFFERIENIEETVVFYESKFRIQKALTELRDVSKIGDRKIVIGREVTKQFETFYRGNIEEVINQLNTDKVLGEFVVVIENK